MHSSLTKVLDRARAAIQGRAAASAPERPEVHQAAPQPISSTPQTLTQRPTELPEPRTLAVYPEAEQVQGARYLNAGERRVWHFLHRLAADVGRERGYSQTPSQVSFHCPAVTIAGALGMTDRHLRRLAGGLERAGLLDCGGHAQQVMSRNMYGGTLWAVLTVPGAEPPRLRADEWRHNWRPDFETDVVNKRGAIKEMSELQAESAEAERLYQTAKRWAAAQTTSNDPPPPSSDILGPIDLRGVLDGLAGLWRLHSTKRPRAVGRLGSQIAGLLGESDRRRYWCGVIWQALTAQDEGRTGGLQALMGQFDRLAADLREGAPWRSPGAVLAARLKASL
ncbi:hypothetical protein [Deinococcus alpinitundrae]|uniref:hypothetical protein n=1 Tax=Deinococcus alpinitundrae TaxID=468913 RepID=UPI00137A1E1B|nr:hypothetical protein [Deinococcus alpinitundrae]